MSKKRVGGDKGFSRETEQGVAASHARKAQVRPGPAVKDRLPESNIDTDQHDGMMGGKKLTTPMYDRKSTPHD